jgi:hypothetical protein
MGAEEDYLCVGICLPDADEAYCIGCGRPWGTASVPSPLPIAVPPAPTFQDDGNAESA